MSLFRAISNYFREKSDDAAEAIGDPVRDAKYDIIDANKQVDGFEADIQRLMKANISRKKELADAKAEVKKWGNIAGEAAAAGNKGDVESAITKKQAADTQVKSFSDEIKKNDKTIASLRTQLGQARNKIAKAKSQSATLAARISGGKLRTELAKSSSGMDGGPLARLGNLETAARDAESDAEAWEELREDDDENLEEKYGSGDASVDDEVAALMAAAKEKETADA
jgi:phage shock protein A